MPDWLVNVLIQYPIVVMVGFVAWYAYRKIEAKDALSDRRDDAAHEAELARLREIHAAAEARTDEFHRRVVAAKDDEIGRLRDELAAELKRLSRRVDELVRRLP